MDSPKLGGLGKWKRFVLDRTHSRNGLLFVGMIVSYAVLGIAGILNFPPQLLLPAIVTSDTYTQYHRVIDQLQGTIGVANVNGSLHFDPGAAFIKQELCGRFPGTIVLAMSCNLMSTSEICNAFIQRGARAFVGWSNEVPGLPDDTVFASLANLLLGGHALGWSIQNATGGLGRESPPETQLLYVPVTQASLTI